MNPPTYMIAPQLQHLGIQSTEESVQEESSLGMSAIIYNYLGNESDVRASVLLSQIKHVKDQKQQQKLPLNEVDLNVQQNKINKIDEIVACYDEPIIEIADSSAKPLYNMEKWRHNNENLNTALHSTPKESVPVSAINVTKSDTHTGSKSPGSKSPGSKSSKSQTTYYTVKENIAYLTPPSGDSNFHISKRGSNTLNIPSPNIQYKELDKSVDWRELLAQKTSSINVGLAKGMSCEAPIKVTSLVDSWLTARIVIDQLQSNEVTIDVPRFPVLLSPLKSECMIFNITSMIELKKTLLPFTIYLKDSSIDLEIQQKGYFEVDFKMPMMQAITVEGLNKGIRFQSVQETVTVYKTFVLISDCPRDLQLDMSISEGNSLFAIANLQEIKRSEIKKYLSNSESRVDDVKLNRNKILKQNKQLCRLTNGNAIKATLVFTAPRLADLKLEKSQDIKLSNSGTVVGTWKATLKDVNGKLETNFQVSPELFVVHPGASTVVNVHYKGPQDKLIQALLIFKDIVSNVETTVNLSGGKIKPAQFPIKTTYSELSWVRKGRKELKIKNDSEKKVTAKFKISGDGFIMETSRGSGTDLQLSFGPKECKDMLIIFEPSSPIPHKGKLMITLDGEPESAKSLDRTSHLLLRSEEFLESGEQRLENDCIRHTVSQSLESEDSREQRLENGCIQHAVSQTLESDDSKEQRLESDRHHPQNLLEFVRFYACDAGPAPSWAGLVTCGETALVAASARAPLQLTLHNRSRVPAFISAKLHFNLQYMSVSSKSRLAGARSVVRGRESARLVLHVDWAGVERAARDAGAAAARTLATLSVLTGAEYTRHRIIRVLREESNGEIKTENLSEHLSRLVGPFEGEDSSTDELLADFEETRKSLEVLVSGIQELSAQVDLTRELSDDVTILISDDSVLEYKTLCD
ncbi:hypothetical protein EVAR_47403_1 [Eumeta japonica]|uniref:Centrosomal protein of 192 kDa n=1 Tax=Eumeta variegata TaxID=151549 RepID=A0A4C1XZT3_EUMVA|nr:hypothetical protein EVAR_47403_1 [Eumeta japonica]